MFQRLLWIGVTIGIGGLGFWLSARTGRPAAEMRTFRIGYGEDAPYHFETSPGRPQGLAVDMVSEAARRRGIKLVWKRYVQSGGPAPIEDNELDFWVLLTDRPDRRKRVHLTEPYLATQACFLVPNEVRSQGDLMNGRIARLESAIHRINLESVLPQARHVVAESALAAIGAVAKGEADAAFLDQYTSMVALLSGTSQRPLRLLRAPVPRSMMALASSFEYKDVADEIREEMRALASDGTLQSFSERWGYFASLSTDVIESSEKDKRANRMLWLGVAVLGLTVVGVGFLALRVRRERNSAKEQGEALRESEERWQLVLRGNSDGIWDHDLIADRLYCSDRWKGMLGYAPEELVDSPATWASLLHPEDAERAKSVVSDHIEKKTEVYSCEYRMRTKRGDYRWILARGRALRNEDGRAIRIAGSHTDITERRMAEEAARLAQREAEKANRSKSEFLANMSHEIRTPAGALVNLARLLQIESEAAERQKLAELIEVSSDALLAVINDVLDISKIEAGKLKVAREAVELEAVVRQVVGLLEPAAKGKQLGLSFEPGGDLPAAVMTDAGRLRQVLLNLIGNAIKFTKSGGVRVSVEAVEGWVRFAVYDTGPGIAAAQQRLLFRSFSQLDATASREQGGAGLGLAISAQLVALMGGKIGLESEIGQGSCFWFQIPLEAVIPGPAKRDEASEARRWPDLRVLLAEDNATNRVICIRLLGQLGIEPDVVADGMQAVVAAERQAYDLILMDVQMPVLDGLEATKRIREAGGKQPLIVALTAHVLEEHRQACLGAGMDDYLAKPLDVTLLRRLLERRLGAAVG